MDPKTYQEQISTLIGAAVKDADHGPAHWQDIAAATIRCIWKCYLEPVEDVCELNKRWFVSMLPVYRRLTGNRYKDDELHDWYFDRDAIFDNDDVAEFQNISSFEEYMDDVLLEGLDEDDYKEKAFTSMWREWKPRIISLSPRLVVSIRDVYQEYVLWLQKHPDVIDTIAWEAFEKLIAEIFASHGFCVDLTGRVRNRSSDILAVRNDEFGVRTQYLIECKRYRSTRRVGMDIINGVIGSARRADVDHSFIVTSSYFTKDVIDRKSEFEQLRLHIRDGDDVREWLKGYKVRSDFGLWLSSGWDEDIQHHIQD